MNKLIREGVKEYGEIRVCARKYGKARRYGGVPGGTGRLGDMGVCQEVREG
jgi:hypothetical protein